MGVSIQQWRNAIGCYQAKSSRKVTRTHKSSSAPDFTRPTITTLTILTILAVSLSSYSINSLLQSAASNTTSPSPCRSVSALQFLNIDHLPPWPPDSCTRSCSRFPTSAPVSSPAPQQAWKVPLQQFSSQYSESKSQDINKPWSPCTGSSPCSSSTPSVSLWSGTWSSVRSAAWTTSSQGKDIRIVKNNFWERYTYGNTNKGIQLCNWNIVGGGYLRNKNDII